MAKVKQKTKPVSIPKNVPFWQNEKILPWIFFAFAFLIYAQTIGYDYALDDRCVTFQNKFVMAGFRGFGDILKTYYWAGFGTPNAGLFRPLSLILFAIEWKLAPNSPHFYHFVNVVMYAISAFLLYKTLRELFKNHSPTIPIGATLLWIVFPAHTEVVANIKSGDELLSIIFFLLMMLQLMKWSENKLLKPLLLSGIFLFLSLLSKEGAVLFFPVALIALYQFRKIELKELIRPGIILIVFTGIWFAWHAAVIANAPMEKITYSYHDNSLVAAPDKSSQVATAMLMQGKYLLKSFFGFPLSYDYSYNENPTTGFANLWVIFSILICFGFFAIAVQQFKKNPVLSFGILFYFITFALTSNIFMLIGATMADRFLFVPSVGFSIALAWLILKLTKGETIKFVHQKALYILLPLTFLYSIRTFSRSRDWKDEDTLFTADLDNAPGSGRVHMGYAIRQMANAAGASDELTKANLNNEAYNQFVEAYKIDSLDVQSVFNLGVVEFRRKNYAESVKWSKTVLKINPKDVSVLENLGDALMMIGQYDSAKTVFIHSSESLPLTDGILIKIGNACFAKHDTTGALQYFEKAFSVNPKSIDALNKIGNVSGMHHDIKRSSEAFLKITEIDPNNLNAYKMLVINSNSIGDTLNAKKYAQEYYRLGGK